ncbi:Dual Specificity Mitogen-Activated Protein Kinase Kinase 6 [Manis pentadactyla]|nr:Dual Specificity Mitogen-Activated Protein Kinase Kinase 6 [Manis pentadactyla]
MPGNLLLSSGKGNQSEAHQGLRSQDDLGKLVADVSELLPDCIFHRSVKPGSFMTYGLGKVRLLERRTGVRMDAIVKDVLVILDRIAY